MRMLGTRSRKTAYLSLDELAADPKLARCLPADLAWRCRALPLAEDRGRVTVVMANPEDADARQAVVSALGPAACVVQGDPLAIDALLEEVWGPEVHRPLDMLVCTFPNPVSDGMQDYAQGLGNLIGAHVSCLDTAQGLDALTKEGGCAEHDLLILDEPGHPLARHLLSRPATADAPQLHDGAPAPGQRQVPFAMLVAQRPRWPLGRILLIVCGESADNAAVDWVLRLARPSGAAVTALALVPPLPGLFCGLSRMGQDLASLLTTDTALGRQMRHVAQRLVESKVEGTLRLCQGLVDCQIRRDIVEGDYDMIVMAVKPCRWWLRRLKGDPICQLLSWADRPVLLVEPITA